MLPEIKVAIADDHKIFRKGVILSLRQYTNLRFIMEAENGEDLFRENPAGSQPDVILCDLKMPIKDGIDATKLITKVISPTFGSLYLTMYEDDRFVGHLMDCGAAGYLLKSTEPSKYQKAIMDVNAHRLLPQPVCKQSSDQEKLQQTKVQSHPLPPKRY
jgi:DNA-binding NarL/FixJ family response regulator